MLFDRDTRRALDIAVMYNSARSYFHYEVVISKRLPCSYELFGAAEEVAHAHTIM